MDFWKTANVTQLKRWISIHHEFLQQCAKRGKQQKRMKVRDIRRYLKGSKNDKNPSTTEHQTSKDTNVTNKEQYGIGKAYGPQTQGKRKKTPQRQTERNNTNQGHTTVFRPNRNKQKHRKQQTQKQK